MAQVLRSALYGLAILPVLFGSTSHAQINPLVPPLSCCDDPYRPCPSRAARCIPLPQVAIPEHASFTDPQSGNQWQVSLYEAINVALANSEVVRNLGLVDARSDVDIVRAPTTSYDPAIADAEAAAEWGIFDPLLTSQIQWNRIDIPPGTSFSGIGNRPPQLDEADFVTSVEQLVPLGTRFRADFVTDYLFNPARPVNLDPNPQYFTYTQFGVTQPLLRGYGVGVNMARIQIAAAEAERTDWQFKQEVLALLRSVETAFWALHAEQANLEAIDEILPMFREIVRVRQEQQSREAGTLAQVSRAQAELYRFEQSRLEIISRIAEQQLVLRNLMGLAPDDGRYLASIAMTTLAPPVESVNYSVSTALRQRPDVLRQRLAVYVAQQEQTLARNNLRPLLDFNAFWRINGLGDDLGSSIGVQANDDYNDWQLGVTFQVPLGRRQARAEVRATQLSISRERALLDQVAHQAAFEVADAHRRLVWLYKQYEVAQARVRALGEWQGAAKAQFETPPPGMSTSLALELYLENLRDYAQSIYQVHDIVANFNSALARLEEVKGTLLDARLVQIEGDGTEQVPAGLPEPESLQPIPEPEPQANALIDVPQQPLPHQLDAPVATPEVIAVKPSAESEQKVLSPPQEETLRLPTAQLPARQPASEPDMQIELPAAGSNPSVGQSPVALVPPAAAASTANDTNTPAVVADRRSAPDRPAAQAELSKDLQEVVEPIATPQPPQLAADSATAPTRPSMKSRAAVKPNDWVPNPEIWTPVHESWPPVAAIPLEIRQHDQQNTPGSKTAQLPFELPYPYVRQPESIVDGPMLLPALAGMKFPEPWVVVHEWTPPPAALVMSPVPQPLTELLLPEAVYPLISVGDQLQQPALATPVAPQLPACSTPERWQPLKIGPDPELHYSDTYSLTPHWLVDLPTDDLRQPLSHNLDGTTREDSEEPDWPRSLQQPISTGVQRLPQAVASAPQRWQPLANVELPTVLLPYESLRQPFSNMPVGRESLSPLPRLAMQTNQADVVRQPAAVTVRTTELQRAEPAAALQQPLSQRDFHQSTFESPASATRPEAKVVEQALAQPSTMW